MSQAELARVLGISPSYLNQMEHDSRPLTVPVLLRLTEAFGVDPGFFSERDTTRLVADLREALAGEVAEARVSPTDLAELASRMPAVAKVLLDLSRRGQVLAERIAGETDNRDGRLPAPRSPHEEIREFFYRRQNYLHDTDLAAEELAHSIGIHPGDVVRVLAQRLTEKHGVRPTTRAAERLHHYDSASRTLHLSSRLRPGQRAFRMATQLALLECGNDIDRLAAEDFPPGSPTYALARIGVANYFAAALILPYGAFHTAAEEVRYDIERLTDRFGLGYETVCHRLSTLQRPKLRGCRSRSSASTGRGTCRNVSRPPASTSPGPAAHAPFGTCTRHSRHLDASMFRSPPCPTGSGTCGPRERSRGTAAAGANPARPSPSAWAARSVTPRVLSTPTGSTSTTPPPPPRSAWAAASANASTAPSARYHHWAARSRSTRTAARSSLIRWPTARGEPPRCGRVAGRTAPSPLNGHRDFVQPASGRGRSTPA